MSLFNRKSIFDILKEAEDENVESSTNDESGETENQTEDTTSDDTNNETEDDYGEDEDFSIDTNLDDDTSDEDAGDDSGDSGDDFGGDSSSSDLDSSDSEEEPIEANTDIFNSLSKEEQEIKIKELKRLFNNLYTSCSDMLEKINTIDAETDNMDTIARISSIMYHLKIYIADYITKKFAYCSYIENDIAFNRFLAIINSVSNVINELAEEKEKKLGIKNDKE